jgi:hypothetical protein
VLSRDGGIDGIDVFGAERKSNPKHEPQELARRANEL